METLPWSPEQVAAAHEVADPVEPSDEEILKNCKKVQLVFLQLMISPLEQVV